ncbi:DnaB-like helicase C-terminal domain-containing protein [Mycoplasma sp. Z473B]|uniref:DnaB-like helicase C-terminal domain-containing protein n=1 Tax=Mycoplasma sp. Z473B TaxID=3401667 RepID=UPI003AAB4CDD
MKTIKNTGFDIIDNQLQGLRPNQLIILGGRPGAGKTTFALNVMNNINSELAENERILFISLEQSTSELLQKSISMKTYFPLKNFYNSENIIADLAKENKGIIKYFKINCYWRYRNKSRKHSKNNLWITRTTKYCYKSSIRGPCTNFRN